MRSSSWKLSAIGAALGICAVIGAAGQSAAGEAKRSGWYIGAGVGLNWTSEMEQAGRNRDTICYPNNDCTGAAPGGYRWYYDLPADGGAAFEISAGRMFDRARLELSLTERRNDVEQKFTGITYLDGSAIVPDPASNYTESAATEIDRLTVRTVSLNVYYDFPLAKSRLTPYLGAGVGVSFVKLSGLYYHSRYSCKDPSSNCERPEQYNSRQDVDLSDTVLSKSLHAGVDYRLNDSFLLGLKLSYGLVDDMEDKSGYSEHAVPGLTSLTKISDMDHLSLMLALKYRFGD